jgi:hypothetical protein
MATYSGKLVTWDEAVKSDLTYAPDRIAWDATPRSKAKADGSYPCAAGHHEGRLTAGNSSSSAHSLS